MSRQKFAAATLAFGVLGILFAGIARAQSPNYASGPTTGTTRPATLADKIDDLGRSIFGGILPAKKDKQTSQNPVRPSSRNLSPARNSRQPALPLSGSAQALGSKQMYPSGSAGAANPLDLPKLPKLPKINLDPLGLDPLGLSNSGTSSRGAEKSDSRFTGQSTQSGLRSSVRNPTGTGPTVVRRSVGQPAGPHRGTSAKSRPVTPNRAVVVTPRESEARRSSPPAPSSRSAPTRPKILDGLSDMNDPLLRPLHERIAGFRQSAFDQGKTASTPATAPSKAVQPEQAESPLPAEPSAVIDRTGSDAAAVGEDPPQTPTPADRSSASPSDETTSARPLVAQRPTPKATVGDIAPATEAEKPAVSSVALPAAKLAATVDPTVQRGRDVLFTRKGPMLSVQTVGPKTISVGKESAYEVIVLNSGEEAAEGIVVFIGLPEWADVSGTEVRTGAAHRAVSGTAGEPFEWRVGHLPAKSQEKLVLRIVPRESRPFDLSVRWESKPVASQTMIEVQEPKLEMSLEGPREVLYGQKELYRLTLTNTGTGSAENVLINLLPIGPGGSQAVSHNLGVLAAGQQRTIEVELTARQVGDLAIRVQVRGDAGLFAELSERVLVRRAALQLNVQGPSVQYVGTAAGFQISVRNPGTAPAHNVKLSVDIPPGAKYLSGVKGAQLAANGTKLRWTVPDLNPGQQQRFTLQCSLGLPGANRMEVVSTADGELTDTASATTRVEAIADLALEVKDPSGPVPIGEETVYEVRITNRGTKNAPNVQAMVYFSHGIEPTKAEGSPNRIGPGQVIFSPVASVPAGGNLDLKIHARATKPGNHVFRAEVHCKPLDTRLVSEETTHFFQSDSVTRNAPETLPPETSPPPAAAAAPNRGQPGPPATSFRDRPTPAVR